MIKPSRVVLRFVQAKDRQESLKDFFLNNPHPSDEQFHTWAEKEGINVHKAEAMAYELAAEHAKHLDEGTAPIEVLRKYLEDTKEDWNYITPEQLHEDKKDYFLLDIRRPEDFKKGHILGAHNIFWLDILKPQNLKKLPKDKTIIVYCYVGHTSSQVVVLLKMLGYDVVGLKFGMGISPTKGVPVAGWTDFNFEVTK